jgi:hypothetical protein
MTKLKSRFDWISLKTLSPAEMLNSVVNVAVLLVSLIGLLVSFLALYIAVRSYQEAVRGGREQQKTLDASRDSLESVVKTAQQQQKLLEESLQASKGLLGILSEEYRRQLERENRRPNVEISLGAMPWEDLRKGPTINVDLTQNFEFEITNKGNAPVLRPIVNVFTFPPSVFVDKAGFKVEKRPNHNHFTFQGGPDILPKTQVTTPYLFPVELAVPPEVKDFDIEFEIFGENLKSRTEKVHCRVFQPSH